MRLVADLHIHSRYAYATSSSMELGSLALWAKRKGIGLLGSGDFTHPAWFAELKARLRPCGEGTFEHDGVRFFLTAEIANVFRRGDRSRRLHTLVFAPGFAAAAKLNRILSSCGSLSYDGRPILRLDARDLLRRALDIDDGFMVIPAHAWTPHFGVLGSQTGFDSLEECFGDDVKHIPAVETGLSSDPAMNWRVSALDRVMLLSNSDAHSPQNIGREANVFDVSGDDLYPQIARILRTRDRSRFLETIEFFPEEGKYHYDGCRTCGARLSPQEAERSRGRCPSCGGKSTAGVLHRVEDLADRPEGRQPKTAVPFRKIVPLTHLLSEALGAGPATKTVGKEYLRLTGHFGTELGVLLDVPGRELAAFAPGRVSEAVLRMRRGDIEIEPGYDGVYGSVRIRWGKKGSRRSL